MTNDFVDNWTGEAFRRHSPDLGPARGAILALAAVAATAVICLDLYLLAELIGGMQ